MHVENRKNEPQKHKNLQKPKETIDSGVLTTKFTIISATEIFLRLLFIFLVHQLIGHIALQGSNIPVLVLPKRSSYFQLPCSQSIRGQITQVKKQICCLCSVKYVCHLTLKGLWTIQSAVKLNFPKQQSNEIHKYPYMAAIVL